MKYLTLFTHGGDGNGKGTILYKDITDFHKNINEQTITFKTQKGVTIETCLPWRMNDGTKEALEALAGAGVAVPPDAEEHPVRRGNQAGRW